MKIAAILSVCSAAEGSPGVSQSSPLDPRVDLLGKSLLQRCQEKVASFGASVQSVISHGEVNQLLSRPGKGLPAARVESWEQAVGGYIRAGTDVLLLIGLNAYSDLDYRELLDFHLQSGAPVTQAYASDGAFDIALVDVSRLRTDVGAYRRALSLLLPQQSRFQYRGYVNRLASEQDCYQLVADGLNGRCGLEPTGTETQPGVWQGNKAEIDPSAVITGPAFIGAGSRVSAWCTIAPNTAIERDCEIDCSTTVQESWIQPNTYVGVALDIRRSMVANDTLFHLDRNVKLNLAEHHFLGAVAKSASLFAGLSSLILGERGVA